MSENHKEDGFYKGLVFGALLVTGAMWLLSTKEGREIARTAKRKIKDVFEGTPNSEDIDEIAEKEVVRPREIPSIPVASAVHHRRYFKRKRK